MLWIQLKGAHKQCVSIDFCFVFEKPAKSLCKTRNGTQFKYTKKKEVFVLTGLIPPSASILQWVYCEVTSRMPILLIGFGPIQLATGKTSCFSAKIQTFFSYFKITTMETWPHFIGRKYFKLFVIFMLPEIITDISLKQVLYKHCRTVSETLHSLYLKRNTYKHTLFLWYEGGSKQQDDIQHCKLLFILWIFE